MAKIIDNAPSLDGLGHSYRIDFENGMVLWFDVWRDDSGEITGDWNKWIFSLVDEQDMREQAFMNANSDDAGAYNYATALELATYAFESR